MSLPIHETTVQFLKTRAEDLSRSPNLKSRPHDKFSRTKPDDKVRFVCISDTHSQPSWSENIPAGDVLIHSGDLTLAGTASQLKQVYEEVKALPHKIKIVIAGNHDLGLDPSFVSKHVQDFARYGAGISMSNIQTYRRMWTSRDASAAGIVFLEHESTVIEVRGKSFKVFGSPWTPEFFDWAYAYPVDCDIWSPGTGPTSPGPGIPSDTDILITHGPPKGIMDQVKAVGSVGCPFLLERLKSVQPMLHVFGHIHEGAEIGIEKYRFSKDQKARTTLAVNASVLDEQYCLRYAATVIDL